MARWMPPFSRPGTSMSRETREPIAITTASCRVCSSSTVTSVPIAVS